MGENKGRGYCSEGGNEVKSAGKDYMGKCGVVWIKMRGRVKGQVWRK